MTQTPVVNLEITGDNFEVSQNSVQFLPNGISVSVSLPAICSNCRAKDQNQGESAEMEVDESKQDA